MRAGYMCLERKRDILYVPWASRRGLATCVWRENVIYYMSPGPVDAGWLHVSGEKTFDNILYVIMRVINSSKFITNVTQTLQYCTYGII